MVFQGLPETAPQQKEVISQRESWGILNNWEKKKHHGQVGQQWYDGQFYASSWWARWVTRFNIISGCVHEVVSGGDEHLDREIEWSTLLSPMMVHIIQSLEDPNSKMQRKEGFISLLSDHLSWDIPFSCPWSWTYFIYSPGCQDFGLDWNDTTSFPGFLGCRQENSGTSQPSKCCEPIPHNTSPYLYVHLYLQI